MRAERTKLRMNTMKNIITLSITALLLAALGTNISFAAKPAGGGKGGKVTVESATPNSVIQTNDEDVSILGTGFDNGSTVRFLVTGTTDDTQIDVSPAQYISSTELRVHIKTTGSTAAVEYDIEVQATSGRKGKGTTLFKVEKSNGTCTDLLPTFAYLLVGGQTLDLFLSSASGCHQQLLVSDIDSSDVVPTNLKLVIRGQKGFVIWKAHNHSGIPSIFGLSFQINEDFSVTPAVGGVEILRSQAPGDSIISADVTITLSGSIQIVILEYRDGGEPRERFLTLLDLADGTLTDISAGNCQVQDSSGECFVPSQSRLAWAPTGDLIYFEVRNIYTSSDRIGIARIRRSESGWGNSELALMGMVDDALSFPSVSLDGLLAYQYDDGKYRGKLDRRIGIVNPDDCASRSSICSKTDGACTGTGIPEHR